MKRLLLILIGFICVVGAWGCYKDIKRQKRTDILINHTWYLKSQSVGALVQDDSCYLSEVLTFRKDSMGNHHYNILCDPNGRRDLAFKWTIPGQWQYMYFYNVGGKKDSNFVYRIWINHDDTLKIGTVLNGVSIISVYTSFQ